jgi:hypothetical protein
MPRIIIAAALLAASACAPVEPDAPVIREPGAPEGWRCDAEASRSLIGRHVGAVSFPQGAPVRVVCTTCPVTFDYRPERLNVRFEEATGIIRSVDCG